MAIRVVLAEDHAEMRQALRGVLASAGGIDVVAEAADGQTAIRLAAELAPDVVVIDVRLPDMSGVEVTQQITRERGGHIKVIVMSAHADQWTASGAEEAGASGFVPKDAAFEELADAVRQVAGGATYRGAAR